MARRRDPSPFGSRERDTPDFLAWMAIDSDSPTRAGCGRLKPEFFRMLRAFRFTRVRLVVEAVALAAGAVMFLVLPTVALMVVVVAVVAGLCDLVVFTRLRRRIAEAWEPGDRRGGNAAECVP